MASIWRAHPLLRATNVSIHPVSRTATQLPSWRSYGSQKTSDSTRQKEHPGPPPPDVGQGSKQTAETHTQEPYSSTTKEAPGDPQKSEAQEITTEPSNKARPTLTTGQQSPNVDEEGNARSDVSEDVKEHNEGVRTRHDRSYNQITDQGKVQKGF